MSRKRLQLQQLDKKMARFALVKPVAVPPSGWIRAIRTATGMSMRQLGKRLSVTRQAVLDMERREADGSITLKSLRDVARAMDMQLVYGFVPNDGSLEALIEKRATGLATEIVKRTAGTMELEDQANSKKRLAMAVKERAAELRNEIPKFLWD
jgi:predicted DNA-binding mobile mystery protein A